MHRHLYFLILLLLLGEASSLSAQHRRDRLPFIPLEIRPDPNQVASDAHSSLATWVGFPGFVADLKMSIDGNTTLGRAIVDSSGTVFVEHLPDAQAHWVKAKLRELMRPHLPIEESYRKQWAFVGGDVQHMEQKVALCRADRPFDHWIWVCDKQLLAIETRSCATRSTSAFLTFEANKEGKRLPAVVALHEWNLRTDELKISETEVRRWTRNAGFDLPAVVEILSVEADGKLPRQTRRSVELSNHRLMSSVKVLADK